MKLIQINQKLYVEFHPEMKKVINFDDVIDLDGKSFMYFVFREMFMPLVRESLRKVIINEIKAIK